MLNLSGKDKIKIAGLVDYKNLYIEKELASGDKTLAFLYPKTSKFYSDIEEECYITTKEDEFIVKEKNIQNDYTEFKCILNLEDIEGKPWERYASEEQTIDKALSLALAGTGWIVGNCSLKKKRTVRATNVSSLDVIQEIRKTYRCDLVFNTLTKTIDVHERLGEDKGTYFIDSLNLKNLAIQGNSYNFFTRIIPIGKDNLRISSINNGKDYLENYQYSNKVKTYYWIDERYTIVENLKEDAEAKLNEISKPYRAYVADIINLAKLNNKYKDILDFKLGDTVHLISKDNKFRDKQRIVKIIEHPDEHELDSVEIANTTLSFEEKQTQFEEAADTINNITTDNGTIDGSTVDGIETNQIKDFEDKVIKVTNIDAISGKIHNLEATNVTITGELSSVKATIGILETNVATIDKLTVTNSASINELQATKASVTQFEAVNASIKVLEANVGNIETLVNGNLTSKNIQAGSITAKELAAGTITSGSGVIGEGAIGNAQISNLSATKLDAGTIDTSLITIAGPNSNLRLRGNRLQVFVGIGNNQIERVSLGDVNGDGSVYGFRVRGSDGKTILLDENGVKREGITNGSINNDKISGDANIDGAKLNINSVVTKINGATTSILGTKIDINGTNLSAKLSQQDTTITEYKKTIDSHSATIAANTNLINLKVDNQTYITDKTNMTNTLNKATSDISLIRGQIALKVEQTDIINAIKDIKIGGRNLFKGHKNNQELRLNDYQGVGSFTQFSNNLTFNPADFVGKEFTISFYAKSPNGDTQLRIYNQNGDPRYFYFSTTLDNALGNAWKYYTYTFTNTDRGSNYPISNKVEIYASTKMGVLVKNIKVEIGNKATDWSPAPEDIEILTDEKISSAKSEIKITTDSIKQDLSNLTTTVSTKADNSTVTSMSNKVASLETSLNGIKGEVSSLETTTSTITTKVNQAQSDATKGINDAKTASDKALSAQNTANTANSQANANKNNITTLTTEVTTVKSNIATLDVNLKGITQRVSSTESTTKTLTTQVNQVDGKINNAKNEAVDSSVGVKDTRSTNESPGWYFTNYPKRAVDEFKTFKVLGVNTSTAYGVLTTNVPWHDSSGGYPVQTFRSNSSSTYERKGTSNTTWGNWQQIEDTNGAQSKANKALTDAKAYTTTEVTKTNNKVSSIETNLSSITSRVSNVESKQTSTDGKIVSLETWKKEAEQKITDASIVSIVSKQFYSKGETDSKYTTQSQLTQLIDSFEFKFTNNTNDNLLKNSAFLNDFKSWGKNGTGNISIYSDGNFKEGNSVKFDLTQENQGLFQANIDCSNGLAIRIYANASRPIDVRFGIEGVLTKVIRIGDGSWKELKLIIPPTSNTGAFIFYTQAGGSHTIYANRFKVQTGNSCTPWSSHQSEVYSTITKIDTDGIHMDCVEGNNRVDINTGGMYITDKSTNQRLLNATGYGITVRGGRFYVDDPKNGYTLLWGRDIVINGGRAIVGTHFNPESPLVPNKMYLNYNNDFKNGVEIGGKVTNNGKDILAVINMMKQESGYLHLTNGMILQWGRLSSAIANGDTVQATVGFPISFPTKCCSVSTTILGVDGQGDLGARYNGALKIMNNSYGVFFARNVTPEKWGSSMEISYIAIGY